MKERMRNMLMLAGCGAFALLPSSCINEDMEDCGTDYNLTYDHRLITNMDDEIREELVTADEVELGNRLRQALTADVFREYGRDLDLSFYANQSRTYQQTLTMNAKQASYTVYLPTEPYRHLAVTNVAAESNVSLSGALSLGTTKIEQIKADTIDSYRTGVYAGRADFKDNGLTQSYHIPLYTTTDAAAIVLDPQDVQTRDIKTYLTDLADGFEVNDSTFTYNSNPIIRAIDLTDTGSSLVCHYGIGMPSRDLPVTRTQYDHASQGSYWQMRVYVTLESGSITENIFFVKEPLKAGYLKIIKGKLRHDGTIVVENPEVGVDVNLEWKPGTTYEPWF